MALHVASGTQGCVYNFNPNSGLVLLAVLASGMPNITEKHTAISEEDPTIVSFFAKRRSKGQGVWIYVFET